MACYMPMNSNGKIKKSGFLHLFSKAILSTKQPLSADKTLKGFWGLDRTYFNFTKPITGLASSCAPSVVLIQENSSEFQKKIE